MAVSFSKKVNSCILFFSLFYFSVQAQVALNSVPLEEHFSFQPSRFGGYTLQLPPAKLHQRNHGIIVGLQKGKGTALELGGEAHWRKISFKKPNIIGATANMEYNFKDHIMGFKTGMWMKRGRVNLTYGGNLVYFTDFNGGSQYSLGPSVGFRLLGLHLLTGYNFLVGDKEMDANTLYVALRYYIPVSNKFTWDRKTGTTEIKKKRRKRKRRQRPKRKSSGRKKRRKRMNGNCLIFWTSAAQYFSDF